MMLPGEKHRHCVMLKEDDAMMEHELVLKKDESMCPPQLDVSVAGLDSTHEDSLCPICLDALQDVERMVHLDCCLHSFCYQCVSRWTRLAGSCPVCKRSCTKIISQDGAEERVVVAPKAPEESNSDAYGGLGHSFFIEECASLMKMLDDALVWVERQPSTTSKYRSSTKRVFKSSVSQRAWDALHRIRKEVLRVEASLRRQDPFDPHEHLLFFNDKQEEINALYHARGDMDRLTMRSCATDGTEGRRRFGADDYHLLEQEDAEREDQYDEEEYFYEDY